ncbi:hypothetical protein QIK61_gp1 [ssRNA phage Gerhypos.3_22]|uniref:Uncharacterized protein n=2 Tax=Fiersviridae TaxID=2842319 RepID=A0A8S5L1F9_9VIRU|nr:hypothetical protein QIK61_gp1 [ssRNA phage Gerhypos.3_22]QDH89249.1 MAG: hypothetical protein H3Bulk42307_000004 [Leviviridae sp.]DAD51315.1 TPA_asm: hypothetical protein [ssRNA phage Gerhypos.3_22]
MKRINKSPLPRVLNTNWELLPFRFYDTDAELTRWVRKHRRKGLDMRVIAEPKKRGKTLILLAVLTLTSGCSGFHPRVDASGGELLLCVDTSVEDRCYNAVPVSEPAKDNDIQE